MSLSTLLLIVLGGSAGALIFAVGLSRWVMARDTGTPEMRKISDAIQEGAEAYLRRQNKTIAMLAVAVAAILAIGYGMLRTSQPTDPVSDRGMLAMFITLSFALGALSSAIAGYMGMWVSIRTNIRVAAAAMTSLNAALQTALASPETRQRLTPNGIEPMPGSIASFEAFVRNERERLGKLAARAGMQAE